MKKRILAWLLFHANRSTRDEDFYTIKNDLLARYAVTVGYDIQHIPGKKCFACGGSGIYHGWYWSDTCNRCWGGWYKRPQWNVLERRKFGKYTFHQPRERFHSLKNLNEFCEQNRIDLARQIEGYIDHRWTKHGQLAINVLFKLYRKPVPWNHQYGWGWTLRWWLPKNWIHAIAHFARYRTKAYPIGDLKRRYQRKRKPHESPIPKEIYDDFPF